MGGVIRTAEDFKSLECAIAALTNRLSALLMAEATQVALDDSENRRQARSLAQGAGHAIKDQGRRDVTLRTTCGQVIVRATYFSRNCDRSKASKGDVPDAPALGRAGPLHGGHRLGDEKVEMKRWR